MDLSDFLKSTGAQDDIDALKALWSFRHLEKGNYLAHQGSPDACEYILLDGAISARIDGAEGRSAVVGLYSAATVITPWTARTQDGVSRLSLEAISDVLVAVTDAKRLEHLMLENAGVRGWGNAIMRADLSRRSDREWCLAALGGADRLLWFRERHPSGERIFPHGQIASYLGMTPVTLSRLRNPAKD